METDDRLMSLYLAIEENKYLMDNATDAAIRSHYIAQLKEQLTKVELMLIENKSRSLRNKKNRGLNYPYYNYQARQLREFTIQELAEFDGAGGKPAYVAVDGIVYDVSYSAVWGGGTHFGLNSGRDLSAEYRNCHAMQNILLRLPKVGVLRL